MSDLSGMWDKSDFIGGETDMEDKMREEFEAFGKRNGWNLNRRDMRGADGAYCNSTVESSWRSWQDCAAHYERQLAAAQADNVRLREALQNAISFGSPFWTDESQLLCLSQGRDALAHPLDTSALDAYVSKLTTWQPIEIEVNGVKVKAPDEVGCDEDSPQFSRYWVSATYYNKADAEAFKAALEGMK